MRTLAFGVALAVMAVGAVGAAVPSGLVWIAQHSLSPAAFYVIATVRIAFGLVLLSAASVSRTPRTLRVLGSVILIAGIATALMGLAAMEGARAIVEWWWQQGSGVVRLTGIGVLAIGGFLAYACAPVRRTA